MLETTEKFIAKWQHLLAVEETEATNNQMEVLRAAMSANNKSEIQAATEHLNDISRPFAERVMDEALREAMKGQKVG